MSKESEKQKNKKREKGKQKRKKKNLIKKLYFLSDEIAQGVDSILRP